MDRVGEGGGEAKKRKKPRKRHIRSVGDEADLGGGRKQNVDKSIFSADVSPRDLENRQKEGRET